MEIKRSSSSKVSKTTTKLKSTTENEFSPRNTFKRPREMDSDIKNPLKMRKIIPETADTSSNNIIDYTFDSDEDFDTIETCITSPGSKENSPKKNKRQVTSKDVCESERIKSKTDNKSTKKSEKHEHFIDASLMDEFFTSFSDDEDTPDKKLSATDSGLGATQTSTLSNGTSQILGNNKFDNSKKNEKIIEETVGSEFSEIIDDMFDEAWDSTGKPLDLSNFTRVTIIDISRMKTCIHVTVEESDSNATALVILSGSWIDSQIAVGESLIVKAKKVLGDWVVNNEEGFIITYPDVLVSGTAVASNMFCARKSIFQIRFMNIDCLPNLKPNDSAMTCGSIVHEILQTALKEQKYSKKEIDVIYEDIMRQPNIVLKMYASDLTYKDTKQLVDIYIPKIHEFIERYIKGIPPAVPDKMFHGHISKIQDIEENVWLPCLGLKGKIDVTAEVKIHKNSNIKKIMPLEIKTGKTSFALDHKGQLYLYVMMLKVLGYEVDSGLLLYIKDNQMQEVKSTVHEQRGLISMRNTMAYYLSMPSVTLSRVGDAGSFYGNKSWEPTELPDLTNYPRFCNSCSYNSLCCVYTSADRNSKVDENHPIAELTKALYEDCEQQHIDYVMNWIGMLEMESLSSHDNSQLNVWSMKPEVREHRRVSITNLKIKSVVKIANKDRHEFIRIEQETPLKYQVNDFREVFTVDDYVMISTAIRYHVCSGFVTNINKNSISINLDRDLTQYKKDEIYSVDQYSIKSPLHRILGTVAVLLSPNDITRRLRKILIDRQPARFEEQLPKGLDSPTARKILDRLNKYQKQALLAVVKANDYVLIKGMPGTGKTETLVALIELLNYLGKSVLVCAHTHNAVDNILLKLQKRKVNFMRLGGTYRIHPELGHRSESVLTKDCDDPEKLRLIYDKQNVIGVTCLGAGHILLSKKIFDYCLVDECSQILQPVLLRPLFSAHKFVFVGDPEQLPAVVQSAEARKHGMNQDIFSRLDSDNNTRVLKYQYRMNEVIMDLANKYTYKGELIVGNEMIGKATVQLTHPEVLNSYEDWVKKSLSTELKNSIVVLNTGGIAKMLLHTNLNSKKNKEQYTGKYNNWYEISVVQRLVRALISSGVKTEDIGIIAPFRAQIQALNTVIEEDVEINTVDQYQGRDKSVILFSCTRSNVPGFESRNQLEYRILEDPKRINVAVTRAKHKLIIIGDVSVLKEYGEPTKKLFSILKDSVIDLKPGVDGFNWEKLLVDLVKINDEDE